ncbi:MAG: hypothetical protein O2855_06380 [Planctomycetota bacterium]|nr:hypothetical protein [Planctomycetota bacterium]
MPDLIPRAPRKPPGVGNIDEALATMLFLWSMAELGFKWTARIAGRRG